MLRTVINVFLVLCLICSLAFPVGFVMLLGTLFPGDAGYDTATAVHLIAVGIIAFYVALLPYSLLRLLPHQDAAVPAE